MTRERRQAVGEGRHLHHRLVDSAVTPMSPSISSLLSCLIVTMMNAYALQVRVIKKYDYRLIERFTRKRNHFFRLFSSSCVSRDPE